MAVFGDHYGRTSIENVVNGVVECMTTLRREVSFAYLRVHVYTVAILRSILEERVPAASI